MIEIKLRQTCSACPEQYWAYIGARVIGYIRLRFGHLTCEYLPNGNPQLTDDDVMVLEHFWDGDEYKGRFDNEEERQEWLNKCKEALLKQIENQ